MHARESVFCLRGRIWPNHGERLGFTAPAALLLTVICIAASSAPAAAGTIYWDMETSAATSTIGTAGIVAGDLTREQAGGTTMLSSTAPSTGYQFLLDASSTSASGGKNAEAAAVGGPLVSGSTAFFSVSFTNTSAGSFQLTGIGFGSRSTATGPQRYSVRSSLDGFLATISGATGTMSANSAWAYHAVTFSSSIALAAGQSISLRLYGSDGTADQRTAGNWRIDDLQVTSVPEPAPTVLLGIAGVTYVGAICYRSRGRPVSQSSRT